MRDQFVIKSKTEKGPYVNMKSYRDIDEMMSFAKDRELREMEKKIL